MNTPTNQGWQCPCCETVYAPHVSSCKCKKVAAIKTQQPLTDNDKINQEARLREEWKKMMEEQAKYRRPNDSVKPDPIPQWPRPYEVTKRPYRSPILVIYKPMDVICISEGSAMLR